MDNMGGLYFQTKDGKKEGETSQWKCPKCGKMESKQYDRINK